MAAITYKRNDRGNREGTEQLPTGKEQRMYYDKIIIGAGLYGLYSALFCGKRGEHVLVLECDKEPFRRATYINPVSYTHLDVYKRQMWVRTTASILL